LVLHEGRTTGGRNTVAPSVGGIVPATRLFGPNLSSHTVVWDTA